MPHMTLESIRPYSVPSSLDALRGPATGTIRVAPPIDTSLNPVYDLTNPDRIWSLYSATVREGITVEQESILNKSILLQYWPTLNLPIRCRQTWEKAFPELRTFHA